MVLWRQICHIFKQNWFWTVTTGRQNVNRKCILIYLAEGRNMWQIFLSFLLTIKWTFSSSRDWPDFFHFFYFTKRNKTHFPFLKNPDGRVGVCGRGREDRRKVFCLFHVSFLWGFVVERPAWNKVSDLALCRGVWWMAAALPVTVTSLLQIRQVLPLWLVRL